MVRRFTALVLLFVVFSTGTLGASAATGGITPGEQTSQMPFIDIDSNIVPDDLIGSQLAEQQFKFLILIYLAKYGVKVSAG